MVCFHVYPALGRVWLPHWYGRVCIYLWSDLKLIFSWAFTIVGSAVSIPGAGFKFFCFVLIFWEKLGPVWHHYATRTGPQLVQSTKLSPIRRGSFIAGWPNMNTPCCNDFFNSFFPLFSFWLSKAISVNAELASMCTVFSAIH